MIKFNFKDIYKIGIEEIDAEHQSLFLLADNTSKSLESKNHKTQLILMNQLIKTVKSHFRNEEEFMEKIGYSGLRFHRDEHLVLERDFEVLVDGLSINSQPDLIAYETLKLITLDVRGLDMLIPKSIAPEPI